jgi:CelD/BcsL family acetyltransferase involved in cellulose biosynthesis
VSTASGYSVRVHNTWGAIDPAWREIARTGGATPFQTPAFLDAWFASYGARTGATPVIVEVVRDDAHAMLLPLVRESGVIRFADGGISDNNAPVAGPALPAPGDMATLWPEIRRALPSAALLHFEKQPESIAGRPNPLLGIGTAHPSPLSAHPLEMGDSYEDYSRSRTTKFRKEQERVWRVYTRTEGARFDLIDKADRALAILADMDRLQGARMAELGIDAQVGQAAYTAHYQHLVSADIGRDAVLGALTCNGETVGALLGVSNGQTVTFVRLAHAGGEWSTSSPGRLVIEQTMIALHAKGVRQFDFSVGDYAYKENFRITTAPLFDTAIALSLAGKMKAARINLRAALRQSPLARRLMGKSKDV